MLMWLLCLAYILHHLRICKGVAMVGAGVQRVFAIVVGEKSVWGCPVGMIDLGREGELYVIICAPDSQHRTYQQLQEYHQSRNHNYSLGHLLYRDVEVSSQCDYRCGTVRPVAGPLGT